MNGIHVTNVIHPSAVIGENVTLGDHNTIGAFAVLTGPLNLGNGNWIGAGSILGAPPEVRSLVDEKTRSLPVQAGLQIGNNNVIREHAQVHQGWKKPTEVGDNCYLMNQVYIAHDCTLQDNVTMASSSLLAGHVTIGHSANLGLGSMVHQGLSIGAGAMVGMGAVVVKDVPFFAKAFGNPARVRGTNAIGMQRLGLSEEIIELVQHFIDNPDDEVLSNAVFDSPELLKYRRI